ncbi:MAG: 5'/3'-nucleotidase SurE [Candidatus Latescibacteria bacterium]|nr:5'/3'-nucleotidase SurE [Candidatus Latescibacterota bacterium]
MPVCSIPLAERTIVRLCLLPALLCIVALCPEVARAQSSPYRILLTNDDGVSAPGLLALYGELSALPDVEVMIVAPDRDYSGTGHRVALRDTFFVSEYQRDGKLLGYSVTVPPASCVTIGVRALMGRKPDLVISGINPGTNAGLVTLSSGTVAAAREAAMNGVPAIAVSLDRPWTPSPQLDYTRAAGFVRTLVESIRQSGLPAGVFLNVNLPAADRDINGVRITRQSNRDLEFMYERRTTSSGRVYYAQSRVRTLEKAADGTDEWAVVNGFISITPYTIDQTATVPVPALEKMIRGR